MDEEIDEHVLTNELVMSATVIILTLVLTLYIYYSYTKDWDEVVKMVLNVLTFALIGIIINAMLMFFGIKPFLERHSERIAKNEIKLDKFGTFGKASRFRK